VPPKSDVVKGLHEAGIPEAEARCAVDAIYSSLSKDQIHDLIDRGAGGVPKNDPDSTTDATDKLTQALAKCQAAAVGDEPTGGPATTTTAPPETTTSGPAFTTTTVGGSGSSAPEQTGSTTAPTAATTTVVASTTSG
jgi:hypothetical protein